MHEAESGKVFVVGGTAGGVENFVGERDEGGIDF